MPTIFISYSRKDEGFAQRLAQSLSDLGADVWIDVKSISAGMKWSRAIQEGLDTCDALIVLVSPDSMASTNVEDEWQYYLEQKKPVIPVLVRPAKMHFQLSRIQYVDFYRQSYEGALRQLHAEFRQHGIRLKSPPAASAPAVPEGKSADRRSRMGLIAAVGLLIAVVGIGGVLLLQGRSDVEATISPTATATSAPTATVLIAEPTADDLSMTSAATQTSTAQPTAEPTPTPMPTELALEAHPIECEGVPPSRLNVGMSGRVSVTDDGGLSRAQNVRPQPGTESEPRVPISEGTEFIIIGGPECADGYIWWQVETTSPPFVTGWTAEGEYVASEADYWLEIAAPEADN